MEQIDCRGGHTQIAKVPAHARRESEKTKVQALVYVGDAMEESIDDLCAKAGELGLLGVPVFMFQEGGDPVAENAYREITRLSRAHTAGSMPARRTSSGSCCVRSRLSPAAASTRSAGLRQARTTRRSFSWSS